MKRREFIAMLGGAAIAWAGAAIAQQTDRVRRIGILMGFNAGDPEGESGTTAFRQGLEKLGWIEGRNLRIDWRWTSGEAEQLKTFAKELVELRPEAILAQTTPSVAALLRETRTIPIVFVQVADPVGSGFVESLAHPGGNATGFINFEASLAGKWVQIMKEAVPSLTRVALLFNPETAPSSGAYFLRPFEAAGPSFGVEAIAAPVHEPGEIGGVIAGLAGDQRAGLVVMPNVFMAVHRKQIVTLAAQYRLPTVYPQRFFVTDGGLISYGVDFDDLFRRAALYVDRILVGAKPNDLPVQQPNKFNLVINLKTAKALGIALPASLLARADEVIE